MEGLAIAAVEFLDAQKPDLFSGENVTIEHLTTPEDFAKYGVMYTPGLVINEKLVSAGRIPSVLEIMPAIEEALAANRTPEQTHESRPA
ncbi:MAG: thioredoxin family protein [Nitrososphaerales archaeon]